jgi:hypothetical protein
MEQAKPMPMEEAKPLPMPMPAVPEKTTARPPLPANENPANLYYPTRQSNQQNRLGDLFGTPN